MNEVVNTNKRLKFSIITPTLNQAQFIEDTIKSVIEQNYFNFEHIIIDGGSTDGTIEILKKYPHLIWISEKDKGQSDAINKGFRMCTGDIVAWLNSDDFYQIQIFQTINDFFFQNSECHFLYGDITFIDKHKNKMFTTSGGNLTYRNLINNPDIVRQPSCFWRREIFQTIGFLNEKYHLVMDLDYFIRIGKKYDYYYIPQNLSSFRLYNDGKSSKFLKAQFNELLMVLLSGDGKWNLRTYKYLLKKFIIAWR